MISFVPRAITRWWQVESSIAFNTYGYPDNFDTNHPFYLYFYVDDNIKHVLDAKLSIKFEKFRAYTRPLEHTHTVTIDDHIHTIEIPAHSHTISATTTNTSGTGQTAHQHTVHVIPDTVAPENVQSVGYKFLVIEPDTDTIGTDTPCDADEPGGTLRAVGSDGTLTAGQVSFKTNCTISGHYHTIDAQTTASGGATTVTSQAGGGTITTSSATAGAEYGIYEDTYPSNVHVLIDNIDITSRIGGPFNPNDTYNFVKNIDITPFIREGGLHELKMTTQQRGRGLPILSIKAIISK